jgi:hypothetical protein
MKIKNFRLNCESLDERLLPTVTATNPNLGPGVISQVPSLPPLPPTVPEERFEWERLFQEVKRLNQEIQDAKAVLSDLYQQMVSLKSRLEAALADPNATEEQIHGLGAGYQIVNDQFLQLLRATQEKEQLYRLKFTLLQISPVYGLRSNDESRLNELPTVPELSVDYFRERSIS